MQHIEVTRDLARSFNHHYGEVFVMPRAQVLVSASKVPGTDGEKMSKSYNNTIGAEVVQKTDDMVDIVVQIEWTVAQRHIAGIAPIGDVNIVVGQQRRHRAAQQGGEMTAHGRRQQNPRIVGARNRTAEMPQLAKWRLQHHMFIDREGVA